MNSEEKQKIVQECMGFSILLEYKLEQHINIFFKELPKLNFKLTDQVRAYICSNALTMMSIKERGKMNSLNFKDATLKQAEVLNGMATPMLDASEVELH